MNHEQSTSSMATTRTETTHWPTYSVARVIGVAICTVYAICHCCLTHGSRHCMDWDLLATAMGATSSTRQKRWLHLSMLSPHDLQRVLDQPVCSMLYVLWLDLTHSSYVVHVCTFSLISCGLRFSHILMTVMCMQLVQFCMCTRSGSPHSVMQFIYMYML